MVSSFRVLFVTVGDRDTWYYNEKREEPGFNFLSSYLSQYNKNDIETMTILSANYKGNLEMTMKSFKPNVICFSPYLFNLNRIFSISESIKKEYSETKICIGGSTATHYAKEIMKECAAIDYIIIGEGEKKLSALVDCIIEHKPSDLIPGLVYRDNLSIVETESNENLISLDCFKSISHDLLESVNVKEVMISGSRGCTRNCSFCTSKNYWGKWRGRPIESIIEEVELVVEKYGKRIFRFIDNSIEDPDIDRMLELAKTLIERNIRIAYKVYIRPETLCKLSGSDFDLLTKSGLYSMFIGTECGNEEDLKLYRKPHNMEQNYAAIKALKDNNIFYRLGFININPFSDISRLRSNCEFLYRNGETNILDLATWLSLYRGSDIIHILKKSGLFVEKDYLDTQCYIFQDTRIKALYSFLSSKVLNRMGKYDPAFSFHQMYYYSSEDMFALRVMKKNTNFHDPDLDCVIHEYLLRNENIKAVMNQTYFDWFTELLDLLEKGWDLKLAEAITDRYLLNPLFEVLTNEIKCDYNKIMTKAKPVINMI